LKIGEQSLFSLDPSAVEFALSLSLVVRLRRKR